VRRRRFVAASLAAVVATVAQAHAFLDHAEPRVGSVVKVAPSEVKLWFNEQIEPAFSSIQVLDSAGRRVDKDDVHVDPAQREVLRISLQPLSQGAYSVKWRAVSVDTHVTNGSFGFRVAP
jgi:methionine-rich copper-binding protein CopC